MRFDWTLLQAGTIALDGGGMFGVVPKVIWQKAFTPDDKNRIALGHNCLLLHPENGGKPILIETGSGGKFDDKNRSIFGLGDRTVLSALREKGVDPADVSDVLVTHLHFDHAGGLTRLAEPGETPDWQSEPGPGGVGVVAVMRSFPNARIHVARQEWKDAISNRSVMSKTYLPENLHPIEGQLRFSAERGGECMPGIRVFPVPGHTWGQQAISFTDTQDRAVVFVPDVMPTVSHVGQAYSMAYDVEPFTTTVTKRRLLNDAEKLELLLVLDHEPNTPVVRVRKDGRGWFALEPQERE